MNDIEQKIAEIIEKNNLKSRWHLVPTEIMVIENFLHEAITYGQSYMRQKAEEIILRNIPTIKRQENSDEYIMGQKNYKIRNKASLKKSLSALNDL